VNEDIWKLTDQLCKLPRKQRAALLKAARSFKKDQDFLRDFPDINVAAVIWHVLMQQGGISANEWQFRVVSWFVDQSLERLLAQGQIVMKKDSNGQERYFALERSVL
jgi:hypothetical protein